MFFYDSLAPQLLLQQSCAGNTYTSKGLELPLCKYLAGIIDAPEMDRSYFSKSVLGWIYFYHIFFKKWNEPILSSSPELE